MTMTSTGSWGALLGRRHLGVAVVLAGGVALYAINIYLTASMLPSIVADIGGERFYAWNTTVFLVASVSSSVLVGKAVQRLGPRGAYLLAVAVFVAGSLLAAASPTMTILLVARGVQGVGGGLLAGLGFALIRANLPQELWSRASALVSAMWGVGTLVGPAVGGVFGELGAWPVAFVALAAAGVALGLLVPAVLSNERPDDELELIPVASMVLLSAAALLVSIAGVVSDVAVSVALLVVAAVAVVWFVLRERVRPARLLPRSTFAIGAPTKWIYLSVAVMAIGSTAEAFVPLFGQRLGGLDPIAAGFLGAALAAGWTLGEIPSASAARPASVRRIVLVAPIMLAGGLTLLALSQMSAAPAPVIWLWVVGLLVAGAGIGVQWPHVATAGMAAESDPAEANRAAAAINTVQLVSNAFGAALAGLAVNLGGPAEESSARLMFGMFALITISGVVLARRMITTGAALGTPQG
jgi:MFS family permease